MDSRVRRGILVGIAFSLRWKGEGEQRSGLFGIALCLRREGRGV